MSKNLHELSKDYLNKANVEVLKETGKLKPEEGLDEGDINELSKKTLGRYVNTAAAKAADHAADSVDAWEQGDPEYGKFMDFKGKKRLQGIKTAVKKIVKEEGLDESTRKHFQQVADVIKSHPDAAKRKELAAHHSEIFAKQNPRFDKTKFHKAADAELKEEGLDEGVNGEYGPDDDEDQLDRIERKKQVKPPFTPDKKKSTDWTSAKNKAKNLARAAMKKMVDKKKISEDQNDDKKKASNKKKEWYSGAFEKRNKLIAQHKAGVNETEMDLEELSSETLKSYRDKAHRDIARKSNEGNHGKVLGRLQGTAKASMRLAGVTPKSLNGMKKKLDNEISRSNYWKK